MKTYLTILLLLIFGATFAQNNKKLERIKALRVAFIANKLDLTPEEAQKFWPIFNQFDDKQIRLRIQKKQLLKKSKSTSEIALSENEMQKLLDQSEIADENITNNRKKFVSDLKGIIPPQKILMLNQLEKEFRESLLKQIRNKRKY